MNKKWLYSSWLYSSLSLLLLLVSTFGCSPDGQNLEPLPAIDLDQMGESVRAQFSAALADVEADEMNPEHNGRLAMLLDAYRLNEKAASVYLRARQLAPDNFNWAYLHGRTLAKLDQTGPATETLRLALALQPGNHDAQFELARLLGNNGETEAAAVLFTQLLEQDPRFLHAHYEYGKFLFEQGQAEAAIESLKAALNLSSRYGAAHNVLAQAYRELGQNDQAAVHFRLFERYRMMKPARKNPLQNEIASLYKVEIIVGQTALKMGARGQHREAAALLEEIATERVGLADEGSVHVNLVAEYSQLGDYDKAQEHIDIAMSLDPSSSVLHNSIGLMRAAQGRYDEAIDFLLRAIELDPDYSLTYTNLGRTQEQAGRLDDAIASYRRAVEIDPFDKRAKYFLARALAKNDSPDEATPQLSRDAQQK